MATRRTKSGRSTRSTSRRGPRGSRGAAGRPAAETGAWIGILALTAAGVTGIALYMSEKKAAAAPPPPPGVLPQPGPPGPPGPTPSSLPQTGDVYSLLTVTQQQAVMGALYAYLASNVNAATSTCPAVIQNLAQMTGNGITNAASLADPSNRGLAVDCFQTAYNNINGTVLGSVSGEGVLDLATYKALMGL